MKINTIFIATISISILSSCVNGNTIKQSENISIKTEKSKPIESAAIVSVNHSAFDKLLKANVSDKGVVNYAAFVKSKTDLQGYLKSLTKVDVSSLSKNEKLAFWINAYNAATIDQIVRNHPVTSILKISNGKVWDQSLSYKFENKVLTLNDIEKKILLGNDLFDARVHFAVNCAALSCPTLANTAFTASNVQNMLTAQTKAALSNPNFNKINSSKSSISKLFDWYKADFIKAEGSVANFINKYSSTKINNNTKIDYLEYNWDLNGK